MAQQTLYILQGPPGSGKTGLAQLIVQGVIEYGCSAVIHSENIYYHAVDPLTNRYQYRYDPVIEGYAKESCRNAIIKSLDSGLTVIADNSNIHAWDVFHIVLHACVKRIPVVFIRVEGRFESQHGVPADVIARMRDEMEVLTYDTVLNAAKPPEITGS